MAKKMSSRQPARRPFGPRNQLWRVGEDAGTASKPLLTVRAHYSEAADLRIPRGLKAARNLNNKLPTAQLKLRPFKPLRARLSRKVTQFINPKNCKLPDFAH